MAWSWARWKFEEAKSLTSSCQETLREIGIMVKTTHFRESSNCTNTNESWRRTVRRTGQKKNVARDCEIRMCWSANTFWSIMLFPRSTQIGDECGRNYETHVYYIQRRVRSIGGSQFREYFKHFVHVPKGLVSTSYALDGATEIYGFKEIHSISALSFSL